MVHRAPKAIRPLPALALALALTACTAMGVAPAAEAPGKEQAPPPGLNTPVTLRAIPRYLLAAPRVEVVWLWSGPGGPVARAMRIGSVPSGTPGVVVDIESGPFRLPFLEAVQLSVPRPWPVEWVKVTTARGDGWVRAEFLEAR